MCDDIEATVRDLKAKNVEFDGDVVNAGFGLLATLDIPGGGKLGLYQPRHALATNLPD